MITEEGIASIPAEELIKLINKYQKPKQKSNARPKVIRVEHPTQVTIRVQGKSHSVFVTSSKEVLKNTTALLIKDIELRSINNLRSSLVELLSQALENSSRSQEIKMLQKHLTQVAQATDRQFLVEKACSLATGIL